MTRESLTEMVLSYVREMEEWGDPERFDFDGAFLNRRLKLKAEGIAPYRVNAVRLWLK